VILSNKQTLIKSEWRGTVPGGGGDGGGGGLGGSGPAEAQRKLHKVDMKMPTFSDGGDQAVLAHLAGLTL